MRIVNIIPSYHPYPKGGSAYSQYRLNSNLSDSNYVQVFSYNNKKKYQLSKNHEVNFGNLISFIFSKKIYNSIREADVVLVSSFFFSLNILVFFLCKVFRKPIIISPRGEFFESAIQRKKKIKLLFRKLLISMASDNLSFHATSIPEKKIIESNLIKENFNVYIIPNSIKPSIPLNLKKKNQILFIGRINPIKNIECIIKVIPYCNCNLVILGRAIDTYEISYKKTLVSLIEKLEISEKVSFLGHIEGNEKNKIISESKALILPSKSENFGNVVIESLVEGTPVIASKGTPWEELDENRCGFHIDTNNINLLKLKIEKIINNDEIHEKFYENSIAYAKNFYHDKIREKWEVILNKKINLKK